MYIESQLCVQRLSLPIGSSSCITRMDRNLLGSPRVATNQLYTTTEIRVKYLERVGLYSHKVNSYVPYIAPLFLADLDNRDAIEARRRLVEITESNPTRINRQPQNGMLAPGSINSSIVNLTTATLGVGTLAIPFALYNAGLILFLVLLLVQAWLGFSTIRQIVSALNTTELHSFEEITCVLFGRMAAVLVEVSILIFCFGTAVSYHITIGELGLAICQKVFSSDTVPWYIASALLTRTGFLCFITSFVLLPLCLFDKITELRFTCLIGLGCILATVCVVVYSCFANGLSIDVIDNWSDYLFPRGFPGVVSALGVLTFAFCSQPNVPTIFYELEDRSIDKMTHAVSRASVLCMFVYSVMGLAGVGRFGHAIAPSIIDNMAQEFLLGNPPVVVAYGLLAFAVCMSFPLNVFPIKLTFEQLFIHGGMSNVPFMSRVVACFVVAFSLVCAIAIPDVTVIFDMIGTTVGSVICFILPAAIYLRILSLSGSVLCRRSRKAWFVFLVGCVLLMTGAFTSIK
jgi:sodium-coupled neutral amino acid transporter 7/8